MTTTPVRHVAHDPRRDIRNAWLCVLLLPVAFVLAFLLGEGLVSLLGYDLAEAQPPLWAILTAATPAVLVMFVPATLSSWFARRAAAHDRRDGWVPAGILIAVASMFLLTNVVAYFAQ